MKSRFMTIAIALFMSMTMMAQNVNAVLNVNVGKLNYTDPTAQKSKAENVMDAISDAINNQSITHQPGLVDEVRSSVLSALSNVRRFTVTDGLSTPPTADTKLVIDGTINHITTVSEWIKRDNKTRQEHTAKICVTLNTKNSQGKVLDSQVFDVDRMSSYTNNTRDEAVRNALQTLRLRIVRYYNVEYPFTAHILERGAEKKDKQKEVYIDLGSAVGLHDGTHFNVYTIGTIGGKETRKQIGRLKVSEVQGDEVSFCKVTSGAKEIKAALDAGQNLLVISDD